MLYYKNPDKTIDPVIASIRDTFPSAVKHEPVRSIGEVFRIFSLISTFMASSTRVMCDEILCIEQRVQAYKCSIDAIHRFVEHLQKRTIVDGEKHISILIDEIKPLVIDDTLNILPFLLEFKEALNQHLQTFFRFSDVYLEKEMIAEMNVNDIDTALKEASKTLSGHLYRFAKHAFAMPSKLYRLSNNV